MYQFPLPPTVKQVSVSNTFTKVECYNLFYVFANGMSKKKETISHYWFKLSLFDY